MPRVSFYTLGCKLNFAETSTIARQFEQRDFEVVSFGAAADVTVINTCSVTQAADRKCRQIIRRAQRSSPSAFIVVTGCYAQLDPDRLAAIPGVDAVLGAAEKFSLIDVIGDFNRRERTQVEVSCISEATGFGPAFSSGERTRAYLKVQDGCDYSCSFCTIPAARGRSRSQPIAGCVTQARELARLGYQEVVLSGVNIGLFGATHGERLIDLLRALDGVDGIGRFRISSIEPNLLTDEIIDFVAESRRFQPHFHLPLQSGDDHVLGKMRRRYRRARYQDRVARIKERMPHACVGVDLIVGFPAETPAHFENSRAFLADLPVSYLHVFSYSARPDAPIAKQKAGDAPAEIEGAERTRRSRIMRSLSVRKRRAFYGEYIGSVREVLWESARPDGSQYGFTDNYVKVRRTAEPTMEGTVEMVRLGTFAAPDSLVGEDPRTLSLPVV